MYLFNRYEIRWGNRTTETAYYARKGTKQGGILSGFIFIEYMNILGKRLAGAAGIPFESLSFNSLVYADDVLLVGQNSSVIQQMLDICAGFEADGFLRWNSTKTKVIKLTRKKYPKKDNSLC